MTQFPGSNSSSTHQAVSAHSVPYTSHLDSEDNDVKAGVCGAWAIWILQYQPLFLYPLLQWHLAGSAGAAAFGSFGDTGRLSRKQGFHRKQDNIQLPASCQRDSQTTKPSNPVSKHQGALFSKDSQRGSSVWKMQLCSIAPRAPPPSQRSQGQKELPKSSRPSLFNSGTYARSCTLWQSQFPFTIRVLKLLD